MTIKQSANTSLAHTHSWTQGLCKPSSTLSKTLPVVSLKTYPKNKHVLQPYSYPKQRYQRPSFGSWLSIAEYWSPCWCETPENCYPN